MTQTLHPRPLALLALALAGWLGAAALLPAAAPPARRTFSPLSNDAAWQRLPRPNPPLPAWARALVASLPRTTAAMLELDHLHRARNPLGAAWAGKLRWVAADEVSCTYARRYAEADLRRAGVGDEGLKSLAGDHGQLPKAQRAALTFARKLTRAAHTVTDDEVAELLEHFGVEKVVAMVHTLAFANFQNRILLALRVEVEPGGPLPPLEVRFDPDRLRKVPVPARPPWAEVRKAKPAALAGGLPDWAGRTFADLGKALEQQKGRKGRIPLPPAKRLAQLPPQAKAQAKRIVWSNVSMGYQPLLTRAWFDCMAAFGQEAKIDRVFGGTLFWVVTRTTECFY
jgi:alkylhydroperoxidase family enzyme